MSCRLEAQCCPFSSALTGPQAHGCLERGVCLPSLIRRQQLQSAEVDSGKKLVFTNNIPKSGFLINPEDPVPRHRRGVSVWGLQQKGQELGGGCRTAPPCWDHMFSSQAWATSRLTCPRWGPKSRGAPCREVPGRRWASLGQTGPHLSESLVLLLQGGECQGCQPPAGLGLQPESQEKGIALCHGCIFFLERTNSWYHRHLPWCGGAHLFQLCGRQKQGITWAQEFKTHTAQPQLKKRKRIKLFILPFLPSRIQNMLVECYCVWLGEQLGALQTAMQVLIQWPGWGPWFC